MIGLADGANVACKCDRVQVAVSSEMRSRVDQLLGEGNFRLITATPTASSPARGNSRSRR